MQVKTRIEQRLKDALHPDMLMVVDESHRHAGHAGSRAEGETHFQITIVSATFEGLPQVARQRMVYGLLAEELKNGVHAVSLKTLSLNEKIKRGELP